MLVDGRLRRDDGKNSGVFHESWREVLDSQVSLWRAKAPSEKAEPMELPVEQWQCEPALIGDLTPIAWRVDQDKI